MTEGKTQAIVPYEDLWKISPIRQYAESLERVKGLASKGDYEGLEKEVEACKSLASKAELGVRLEEDLFQALEESPTYRLTTLGYLKERGVLDSISEESSHEKGENLRYSLLKMVVSQLPGDAQNYFIEKFYGENASKREKNPNTEFNAMGLFVDMIPAILAGTVFATTSSNSVSSVLSVMVMAISSASSFWRQTEANYSEPQRNRGNFLFEFPYSIVKKSVSYANRLISKRNPELPEYEEPAFLEAHCLTEDESL